MLCNTPGCFFLPKLNILMPVLSLDVTGFRVFTEIQACDKSTFNTFQAKLKDEQMFMPSELLNLLKIETFSTPTSLLERLLFVVCFVSSMSINLLIVFRQNKITHCQNGWCVQSENDICYTI